jgi:hypothetical protein
VSITWPSIFDAHDSSQDGSTINSRTQPPITSASGCTPTPTNQQETSQGRQILAQGHCDLTRADGLDADSGRLRDQDASGVDLSPKGGHLQYITGNNRGSQARLAVLPEQGAVDYSRCSDTRLSYEKDVRNVPNMLVGDQICIRTDHGNVGLLTLTEHATGENMVLSIDFITWNAQ